MAINKSGKWSEKEGIITQRNKWTPVVYIGFARPELAHHLTVLFNGKGTLVQHCGHVDQISFRK